MGGLGQQPTAAVRGAQGQENGVGILTHWYQDSGKEVDRPMRQGPLGP